MKIKKRGWSVRVERREKKDLVSLGIFRLADNRREKGGATIGSSSVCQADIVLFVTICFAINKRKFFD